MGKVTKTDDQWRTELDSDVYEITRRAATERPFTGKYCHTETAGIYHCTCCGTALFDSATKYNSGSGWPSFYTPIAEDAVSTREDHSMTMQRVEVLCARCDSHLGHLFPDGPEPTGLRYCLNSASLDLQEKVE